MKKALLILLICFTARAYAQTISYGVTAGFTYTNLPGTGTLNYSPSSDYIPGYQFGGVLDIGFKSFSIQPAILYTTTGGQGKVYFTSVDGKVTDYVNNRIVLDYLRIPVNFLYKFKAGTSTIFIGGGPYVGIGVSGKVSYATNKNYGTTDNLNFGSAPEDIKNPDLGINIIEGFRLKSGFAMTAGYSSGLSNVYNTDKSNKNRGFNLSVGYFF